MDRSVPEHLLLVRVRMRAHDLLTAVLIIQGLRMFRDSRVLELF